MDERTNALLDKIKYLISQTFGDNLVGIYLHGSLAFGCFNWDISDIDFIVLLKSAPSQAQKERCIKGLLELNKLSPPKGLEMSVVFESCARDFSYPTPFELHFSNAHLKRCEDDLPAFCRQMHGEDKDLAAHFTVIKAVGIALCGRPIPDAFGEVPPAAYLDSIGSDIAHATEEITDNPVYIILNLCRVLAYKRDGLVLSKQGGGEWGTANLDARYRTAVEQALSAYCGGIKPSFDSEALIAFAKSVSGLIFGMVESR